MEINANAQALYFRAVADRLRQDHGIEVRVPALDLASPKLGLAPPMPQPILHSA